MAEVFLMMKEMEVWDLTRFAEDHGAALQVRANNCTALHCLPCCCPFASISHRASRGQGVPLLGSCGGMTPLSSSICHPKILEHISCMLGAAGARDGCNSWRTSSLAHGFEFSAQSLLFLCVCNTSCTLNKASSKFLLEENVMTWFWGQHQSWYKKRRIRQVL